MSKIEQLLGIAADSNKMPGWEDGLTGMLNASEGMPTRRILSMDDLQMVAGGTSQDSDIAERIRTNLKLHIQ